MDPAESGSVCNPVRGLLQSGNLESEHMQSSDPEPDALLSVGWILRHGYSSGQPRTLDDSKHWQITPLSGSPTELMMRPGTGEATIRCSWISAMNC
jgi:hypothetical protein